jgi:hypothetical protein
VAPGPRGRTVPPAALIARAMTSLLCPNFVAHCTRVSPLSWAAGDPVQVELDVIEEQVSVRPARSACSA